MRPGPPPPGDIAIPNVRAAPAATSRDGDDSCATISAARSAVAGSMRAASALSIAPTAATPAALWREPIRPASLATVRPDRSPNDPDVPSLCTSDDNASVAARASSTSPPPTARLTRVRRRSSQFGKSPDLPGDTLSPTIAAHAARKDAAPPTISPVAPVKTLTWCESPSAAVAARMSRQASASFLAPGADSPRIVAATSLTASSSSPVAVAVTGSSAAL